MKLLPTHVGADRKKVLFLCGLTVALVAIYVYNRASDSGGSPQAASTPAPQASSSSATVATLTPLPPQRAAGNRRGEASVQDGKLSMKPPEGIELSKIDPTIRLDLLARLQKLPLEGGERNLFDFGAPPAPKIAAVAPINPTPAIATPPVEAPPAAPPKPITPPPPPIPLKFYGFVNGSQGGSRSAFFLEGEDIYVAGENDVVHNRYKIIRIGVNSAVVEDTSTRNRQTLPLVEELKG